MRNTSQPPAFTTCATDSQELAKLPRGGALDPTGIGRGMAGLTRSVLRWYDGTSVSPSMQNSVVPYIYGRCAFADIADALATATDAAHRIYLLGWWIDPFTRLKEATPPLLLSDLLRGTKATVRGMFWEDPTKSAADNRPIVDFLNGLPNGAGILDQKLPLARLANSPTGIRGGVHHQKLVVVFGSAGLIAFTGGMDVNNSRVSVSKGGYEPLHDVHVRVTGPAAIKLLDVFRQRWLDHPDSYALDVAKFKTTPGDVASEFDRIGRARNPGAPLPSSTTPLGGRRGEATLAVGVGRTFANLRKFNTTESYAFAPQGEETAWRLIEAAIRNARQYIYIEDQYFVSRRLKTALVAKLREPQFRSLVVLMEESSAFESADRPLWKNEFPYVYAARNETRADFLNVDPHQTKWRMYSLKPSGDAARQEWCGSYVHSKTFVFDDEFAIIGTANADDRGYTYDSEIVTAVTDDPLGRASGQRFARDLRVALWHKHLAVPHAQLADWQRSLGYWKKPPSGAMVFDNSALEDSPLLGPKAILKNFPAADRLWREDIDPDADLLP